MTASVSDFMRRLRRLRRRYREETDGATAVEFGIVAIPFLALVFGILELALIFFIGSAMSQSVSDTGRLVRVGAFQGCGKAAEFKALVCDGMKGLMGCENNLRIDLMTASSFQSVKIVDPGDGGVDPDDDDKAVDDGTFATTGPSDPVILKATFYYPMALPNFMTRLESIPGSGRHIITSTTAFRNEPFPAGSTCNTSLVNRIKDAAGDVAGG